MYDLYWQNSGYKQNTKCLIWVHLSRTTNAKGRSHFSCSNTQCFFWTIKILYVVSVFPVTYRAWIVTSNFQIMSYPCIKPCMFWFYIHNKLSEEEVVRRRFELPLVYSISGLLTEQRDSFGWHSLPSCDFRSISTLKEKCLQIDLPAMFGGKRDKIKKWKQEAHVAKCLPLSCACHLFLVVQIDCPFSNLLGRDYSLFCCFFFFLRKERF